ncbi:MAG: hypothetical protein ABJA57_06565 [Ginsengibacter sp.]
MDTNSPAVGLQRFNYFLNQLQIILDKADESENPALLIFQQNIRTPFFMLEALTRIYKKIYGQKFFKKLNLLFKEMEDSLGVIDYYNGFYNEFISKKNIPATVSVLIKKKEEEAIADLNSLLENNNWLGEKRKMIRKILKKLNKISWQPEAEDAAAVKAIYQDYISSINEKFRKNKILFNSIEKDVHELRRELRWLSIYPQAFRGLMQLHPMEPTENFRKYLTNEIVSSPYNIMPDGTKLENHIQLNANNFYALSWLIAELGKHKDNGLTIIILEETLTEAFKISQGQAEELAYALAGDPQMKMDEILDQSKKIATTFFTEKNLEALVG